MDHHLSPPPPLLSSDPFNDDGDCHLLTFDLWLTVPTLIISQARG